MFNKTVKKIHHHRIGFLILISVLFLTYLGFNPIDISKYYGARFGSAVGMNITIPENPVNKIAKQLKEKEENLNLREEELKKREAKLKTRSSGDETIVWILGTGIITLFLLILINFYLDRRHRSQK